MLVSTTQIRPMKSIRYVFLYAIVAASAAVLVGCATTQTSTQNRENMLVASGFKAITPKTPAQQQKLQSLPPGKVTMMQRKGKAYYISQTQLITWPMSVDPSSTAITNSYAPKTS